MNNLNNNSNRENFDLDCDNGLPTAVEFLRQIEGLKILILVFPLSVTSVILWMYSRNLKFLVGNVDKSIKTNCISLVTIYPIAGICSFFAICIPRAYFFMDSISHISFMVYMIYYYLLYVCYINEENAYPQI